MAALVELHPLNVPDLEPGAIKVGVRRQASHSLNDMIAMRAVLLEAGYQVRQRWEERGVAGTHVWGVGWLAAQTDTVEKHPRCRPSHGLPLI